MSLLDRLAEAGFPYREFQARHPRFTLQNAVHSEYRVCVSGQIPVRGDGTIVTGKAGGDVSLEETVEAARLCAAISLYAAMSVVESEEIIGVERLTVYVRCADGFDDTSAVAEGASLLLCEVLGESGVGARAAVGVNTLPRGAVVEITVDFVARYGCRSI